MEILARKSLLALLFALCLLVVCVHSKRQEDPPTHAISKRPTVLLNRLMSALQTMLQPEAGGSGPGRRPPQHPQEKHPPHQELERRGYPKHYWKCYFNAVSCFRRKRQLSSLPHGV